MADSLFAAVRGLALTLVLVTLGCALVVATVFVLAEGAAQLLHVLDLAPYTAPVPGEPT